MPTLERFLATNVRSALSSARCVFVLGARQCGKSTLVREMAELTGARVYDLDDEELLRTVASDPAGFIYDLEPPVVIDEVQREPGLLLAIKRRVDRDSSRGQFLLTGSADIRTLPTVSDALPGRIDYLTLQPFSQGELLGKRERFLIDAFEGRVPKLAQVDHGKKPYVDRIALGGYPEARLRTETADRTRFFASYLSSIFSRDRREISHLPDSANLTELVELVAAHVGGLMNYSAIGEAMGIDSKTVKHRLSVLDSLQLAFGLKPWSGSRVKRLVRSPKYYVNDSGLLATLLGADAQQIVTNQDVAGKLFESFAITELRRQMSYSDLWFKQFYYRDRDGHEVDLIIEHPDGRVIAVEAKAKASIGPSDFRTLRFLRDRLGNRFALGIVLATCPETVRYQDRLYAVPLAGLWTA